MKKFLLKFIFVIKGFVRNRVRIHSATILSITTFTITTFTITILSIITFSIKALSIMGLFVTVILNDTQHNDS